MGQSESKFDDNEMDGKLLTYRKHLMTMVQNNQDTSQIISGLIGLPVPISMKYACLNVKQLFSLNNKTVEELKKIPIALNILEKYGRHLLKPLSARAEMWRSVKFSNPIYRERVNPLKGSSEIMYLMGYTMTVDDGVYFPEHLNPDHNHTLNLVCDLIIAKTEIELYLNGTHPQSSDIEQFLPEDTVAHINAILHRTSKPRLNTTDVQTNRLKETDIIEKPSEDTTAVPMCEICCLKGDVYCEECDNKVLCITCDIKWHQHASRRQHAPEKRKKVDSNFVTKKQTRITHQGAYGVSEVIKRKPDPVPVDKPQQDLFFLSSMMKESDTDPSDKSMPQSHVNQNENIEDKLRRHHLKIKSYSEQSTKYQPVKFTAKSSKPNRSFSSYGISYPPEFNDSPVPSASSSMNILPSANPSSTMNISPLVTRSENDNTASATASTTLNMLPFVTRSENDNTASASPSSTLNMSPLVTRSENDNTASASPSSTLNISPLVTRSENNNTASASFSTTMNILPLVTRSENDNTASASSSTTMNILPLVTRSENDNTASASPSSTMNILPLVTSSENNNEASANPNTTLNISPLATSSYSTSPSSRRNSKLLEKIVNIEDINIRKSKCEINILAAEDEIIDIDEDLNKILSQDDTFLQNDQFVSLTKKKSLLIREKKSLEDYLKKLDSSESHSDSTVKDTKITPIEPTHRKETLIDNDEDNDEDNGNWICSFCTYSNTPQVHVCLMCSKTNDKLPMIPTMKKTNEATNKAVDIENVGSKFNILQDQVYLEKKAAQSLYQDQLQKSAISTHLDQTTNNPSVRPARQTEYSDRDSITDDITDEDDLPTLSDAEMSQLKAPLEQFDDVVEIRDKKDHVIYNGVVQKREMKEPVTTASFQEIMKMNSQMKLQNEIKANGLELFKVVKLADNLGYDIEEVEVALAQLDNDSLQVIDWLNQNWQGYIDSVLEKVWRRTTDLVNDTVGEMSISEAKDALKKCKGNIDEAVRECITKRQLLYSKFNFDESIPREDVLNAMLECNGDSEKIEIRLNQIALQPFIDRVWEDEDSNDYPAICNSVSNSIIEKASFQDAVRNSDLDKERRTRMVFMEGNLKSWGRAETVIKIVDEELSKPNFNMCSLDDVIEAVRNCVGFKTSVAYLQQECAVCYTEFPMNKITSLNICQCKLCVECIKQHFEHCVRDMNVLRWSCPVCSRPNMADYDTAQNYLSFLTILINNYCDETTQDLFDKKANLWNIQQDPNFRWCAHCETGFIFHGDQLCMTCSNCSKKTCFQCKKEWEDQHENITCEEFEQWKYDNDPNNQALGLANHLKENGIDCPSCKMRYSLSKGGCMHFTCPQCSHEFCSGCCQPFYHQNTCPLKCVGKGLHCHHPRDCFFYLRDEEPATLQKLLQIHKKSFDTNVNENSPTCPVMEQKERSYSSNYDEACGKEVKDGWAGLCIDHYKEYLVGLINKHNLDPLKVIEDEERLKIILKRLNVKIVKQKQNENNAAYIVRLKKIIQENEPLIRPN